MSPGLFRLGMMARVLPNSLRRCLGRSDRIDAILAKIADCQQKLKSAKEKKAKALEVLNNPETRSALRETA